MKRHAREMRKAPTRGEDRIWASLRNRSFDGLKFRRQVPVGPYILDFYCPQVKLGIEVDGKHHQDVDMTDYDGQRSRYLSERGIYVLRIPNEILIRDAQIVSEMIRWATELRFRARGL